MTIEFFSLSFLRLIAFLSSFLPSTEGCSALPEDGANSIEVDLCRFVLVDFAISCSRFINAAISKAVSFTQEAAIDIVRLAVFLGYFLVELTVIFLFCHDLSKFTKYLPPLIYASSVLITYFKGALHKFESNVLTLFIYAFGFYFMAFFYSSFRQLLMKLVAFNFKNKESLKCLYTVILIITSVKGLSYSVIPSVMILFISMGDVSIFKPPRFFKEFMIFTLTNTTGGKRIMDELVSTKYSGFLKCNPCVSNIGKIKFNQVGVLRASSGGQNNSHFELLNEYNFGECKSSIHVYPGVGDRYFVTVVVYGSSCMTICKRGGRTQVNNLINCFSWLSNNFEKGVDFEGSEGHCLDFQEIMEAIFDNNYDFLSFEVEEGNVTNLGTSEFSGLLMKVYNYRSNLIKILEEHNKYFFENEENLSVLMSLLKDRCALGQSGIGSSVYKRYCSEVNEVILETCGVRKYIKMVEEKKRSEKLQQFISTKAKVKFNSVKVKSGLKEAKVELYKRLKIHNKTEKKSEANEWASEINLTSNKEKEEEKVVKVEVKFDRSYLEALKSVRANLVNTNKRTKGDVLCTESMMFKTVPKLKEKSIVVESLKRPHPIEVYESKKQFIKDRSVMKIEKFISENDKNSPEFEEKLRRALYYTREFYAEDFNVKVKEKITTNNQTEIDKVNSFNDGIKEKKEKHDKNLNDSKEFIDKTASIIDKIVGQVERGKWLIDLDTNLLENKFSPLLDCEKVMQPKKLKSILIEKIIEKEGSVKTVCKLVGKRAAKEFLEKGIKNIKSKKGKNRGCLFTNEELKEEVRDMVTSITNEKTSFSCQKICEKTFGEETTLRKQIIRRLKLLSLSRDKEQLFKSSIKKPTLIQDGMLDEAVHIISEIAKLGYPVKFEKQISRIKEFMGMFHIVTNKII